MIVVKVELWPGGRESGAREIGRASIANVSALAEVSSYVGVIVNDANKISVAAVRGHRRDAGIWPLLARMFSSRASTKLSARELEIAERMLERAGPVGDGVPGRLPPLPEDEQAARFVAAKVAGRG